MSHPARRTDRQGLSRGVLADRVHKTTRAAVENASDVCVPKPFHAPITRPQAVRTKVAARKERQARVSRQLYPGPELTWRSARLGEAPVQQTTETSTCIRAAEGTLPAGHLHNMEAVNQSRSRAALHLPPLRRPSEANGPERHHECPMATRALPISAPYAPPALPRIGRSRTSGHPPPARPDSRDSRKLAFRETAICVLWSAHARHTRAAPAGGWRPV